MDSSLASNMTMELRKTIMPVTIFFGFEIVVGIIGNLLTIYVFLMRYKPCNFRYFVIGLGVTDFIACLTTIPGEVVSQLFWYTYPLHFRAVCKTKAYFNHWTVFCEAGFLTLIALDRYRKICNPLKWQIKRNGAMYGCLGVFVFSSLFTTQTAIFWGVNTQVKDIKGINTTVTLCEKDQKYYDTEWPQANIGLVGSLHLLAVLTMLGMYIAVAKRIRAKQLKLDNTVRSQEKFPETVTKGETTDTSIFQSSDLCNKNIYTDRSVDAGPSNAIVQGVRELPKPSENRRRMFILRAQRKSMMGFCLTIIFVVTTVLYWALISLVAGGILSRITDGVTKVFFFFFLRLYFINHIINPILYGLMDPQFRQEMRRLKNKVMKPCTT